MHRLALILVATASLAGCAGTVTSSGTVVAAGMYDPELVEVSPGVQVVADYDEPVFYNDRVYWRYYDGGWYRSDSYNRGWRANQTPPPAITRIERPYTYRHYRPAGYTPRGNGPVVRDHRR